MHKILFLLGVFCVLSAHGAEQGVLTRTAKKSFLTAQSFPSTFADVSFADKIAVLAAGYEPWESEYDANGKCVKNCAYSGITIADELRDLNQHTQNAVQQLQQAGYIAPQSATTVPSYTIKTASVSQSQIPLSEPVLGAPRISSSFGERIHPVTGKRDLHKGVDYAVPSGTQIYAPADGTVTSVWRDNSCGNGLKITHGMGYETVYCHLQSVSVVQGDNVSKNSVVAVSGNTGRSTGAHLHYGIKKDGKYINPSELTGR